MTRGRGVISRWAWRAYDAYDRFVYPGTDAPADHWVRIVLNAAAKRLLARQRTIRITLNLTLRDTQTGVRNVVSHSVKLKVKR